MAITKILLQLLQKDYYKNNLGEIEKKLNNM